MLDDRVEAGTGSGGRDSNWTLDLDGAREALIKRYGRSLLTTDEAASFAVEQRAAEADRCATDEEGLNFRRDCPARAADLRRQARVTEPDWRALLERAAIALDTGIGRNETLIAIRAALSKPATEQDREPNS